jgi:CRP-like cAMP-binding protein
LCRPPDFCPHDVLIQGIDVPKSNVSRSNALLSAIPGAHRQRLLARLKPVDLIFGDVLYEPGDVISHVYFPVTALVSLLTLVEGRLALEVGMIGHEGMLGIPLAMGVRTSPVRALVQGAGLALKMPSSNFLKEFESTPPLRRQVYGYAHALMLQISQSAACNRFHVVDARLARWLLMTRDRVGALEFGLTHQFLANMLGVRREGVTQAANHLQERGLIEYGRGILVILDEAGLESAACSCYEIVRIPLARRRKAK